MEGDATTARSRARESNQNQLKVELLFQGLLGRGGFQQQKLGMSLPRGAPHHTALLSQGVVGLRVGFGEKGSPRGALCLLPWPPCVAELLSSQATAPLQK